MFNSGAPCKGCTQRYSGCHDRCEKYRAWKAECQRKKDLYREYKLRRREDYLHSEQSDFKKREFAGAVKKWNGGKNHGS